MRIQNQILTSMSISHDLLTAAYFFLFAILASNAIIVMELQSAVPFCSLLFPCKHGILGSNNVIWYFEFLGTIPECWFLCVIVVYPKKGRTTIEDVIQCFISQSCFVSVCKFLIISIYVDVFTNIFARNSCLSMFLY